MKNYDIKKTAGRIRDLRKIHRYTQEKAAELLKIDRRSLSHIENASKGCSVDLFIRIADVYNVSLDYLLLGDNPNQAELKANLDAIISQLAALRDIM